MFIIKWICIYWIVFIDGCRYLNWVFKWLKFVLSWFFIYFKKLSVVYVIKSCVVVIELVVFVVGGFVCDEC